MNSYFIDMVPTVDPYTLIFQRKDDSFTPGLSTWYFFDSDSICRGFQYNWSFFAPDFNQSENLPILEKEFSRKKEYRLKYREVLGVLKSLIGQPTTTKKAGNRSDFYAEMATWDFPLFRTILVVQFDPRIIEIPGTEIINGGLSTVTVQTFMK